MNTLPLYHRHETLREPNRFRPLFEGPNPEDNRLAVAESGLKIGMSGNDITVQKNCQHVGGRQSVE